MMILYGTQQRYAPEVIAHGVYRDSAAFFLLPDVPEREKTRRTLACTIYHAFGLLLLQEAILNGQSLGAVLEKSAGGICLICLCGITSGTWNTDCYLLQKGETYPYVKISQSGPVDAREKRYVCLPSSLFDERISSDKAEPGFRFFQKQNGKAQYLPGCDMLMLERLCMFGAEHCIIKSSDCFGEGFL